MPIYNKAGKNSNMHVLSNFLKGNKTDRTYRKEKAGAQKATHPAALQNCGKFRKKEVSINPKLMDTIEIANKKQASSREEKESFLFSKKRIIPTRIPMIPTTKTKIKFQFVI